MFQAARLERNSFCGLHYFIPLTNQQEHIAINQSRTINKSCILSALCISHIPAFLPFTQKNNKNTVAEALSIGTSVGKGGNLWKNCEHTRSQQLCQMKKIIQSRIPNHYRKDRGRNCSTDSKRQTICSTVTFFAYSVLV